MHRHISVIIHAYMHTYMYISYRTYINIYIYISWCESNPVPKGCSFFLRFLYDFLIQCSKQGDCLTSNSGSPTKRLLQVTEMDSGAESTYLF